MMNQTPWRNGQTIADVLELEGSTVLREANISG